MPQDFDAAIESARETLRRRMTNSRMSVVSLAEELKLDRRTLAKVLKDGGHANISPDVRRRLASISEEPSERASKAIFSHISRSLGVDDIDVAATRSLSNNHFLVFKYFSRSPSILATHLHVFEEDGITKFTEKVKIRHGLVASGFTIHEYNGLVLIRRKIANFLSFEREHIRQMSVDFGALSTEKIAPGLIIGRAIRTDLPYTARVLVENQRRTYCQENFGHYEGHDRFVREKSEYLSISETSRGVVETVNPFIPRSHYNDD